MTNKVRVSGILINPVGEPISGAVITFTSVTNSLSVLSGESASINTNTEGSYSTELSYGEYSITISRAGKNSLYGAITIADTTGPSTINELLKQQIMETEVTPDVILYFRQIQKQVASDLATMNVLNGEALDAATRAGEYRDEAGRYAADLSDAVATARRYRDEAGKSAAASLASEQKSKQSETNAQTSETNSAESERNALIYKNTAVAAAETAAEDASTLAAEKTEQKITAAVKQDADRAELARDESESIQADVTAKFNQVNANATATLTAHNEAVNAATSAGQSATTSTNNANATAQDRLATAADKQQVSSDKATSQSAASTATTKAQLATTEANRATTEADRAVAALTGKQDKSTLLTAISALSTAASQLIYLTGKDAVAVTALTDLGRRIIAATKPEYVRSEIGAADDTKVLKIENNLSEIATAESKTEALDNLGITGPISGQFYKFNGGVRFGWDLFGTAGEGITQANISRTLTYGTSAFSSTPAGGAFAAWKQRGSAIFINCPNAASEAYSVWKAVQIGLDHIAGLDVHLPPSGQAMVQMHVGKEGFSYYGNGDSSQQGSVNCRSVVQTSDRDKKHDIEDIEDADDIVMSWSGKTFKLNDGGRPSAGIIAQDIAEKFPVAVIVLPDGSLGVDYSTLHAPIIESMKKRITNEAAMLKRIEELEARLDALSKDS